MTLRNAWDRFESGNISPQQRDLECWYKDHVGDLPTLIANLHTWFCFMLLFEVEYWSGGCRKITDTQLLQLEPHS